MALKGKFFAIDRYGSDGTEFAQLIQAVWINLVTVMLTELLDATGTYFGY